MIKNEMIVEANFNMDVYLICCAQLMLTMTDIL